ncbi:MAG TPA: hypothetical protein VMB48_16480 [Steroidobacteraceae bacterium]|nr:hypothetical protein [Steroidobacteraceae bacterium]
MITFIIIAAAMLLAVAGAVAVPLLRTGGDSRPARLSALAMLAVLAAGAASLYAALGNRQWTRQAADAGSPQAMVGTLARRLALHPDDFKGWLMLGGSYSVLGEWPLAVRAYERADELADGHSADALLGLSAALISRDDNALDGRANKVIERALVLAPHSPQALFYGAAAAIHRHDLPLARQRFVALLALDPPGNVRNIIQQQIAAIDAATAGASGAGSGSAAPVAGGAGGAPPSGPGANPQAGTAAAAAGTRATAAIHVRISLAHSLDVGDLSGASLFVFVRDPSQGGPPLAVKRLTAHFPQNVELSSADAMIPGRQLQIGQQVQIVARISRGGGPLAQRGDPFGQTGYRVTSEGNAAVVIDRLSP